MDPVTPENARAYLTEFGHGADVVKSMSDSDVVKLHSTVSTAAKKHGAPVADPNKPWYEGFQSPEAKDWLKSYGAAYPNAEAVALKALNLERFVGAEKAQRGVVIPKPDAPDAEKMAFWKRVGGVPESAEGYKIPEKYKSDPTFTKLQAWAHSNAMPMAHWEAQMKFFDAHFNELSKTQIQGFENKLEEEWRQLDQEWGPAKDKNIETARRAVRAFMPEGHDAAEFINKMEGVFGTKVTMNLWKAIGEGMGEHAFIQSDTAAGTGMTPEAARIKIAELKRDPEFSKKIQDGNSEALAEWSKLHKVAAGTGA